MRRLGDLLQRMPCLGVALLHGNVAERNNADQVPVAIDDGHAPDLRLLHPLQHLLDRFILLGPADVRTQARNNTSPLSR
jgi:hypothetical protein